MSRVDRLRRRAGQSVATHERARGLAALRLDESLQHADEVWLDAHLAGCETCRSVADAYKADRSALRSLRERRPEPPRDLWARTAAAIERDAGSRGRRRGRPVSARRRAMPALGILSGVAVIAVVIGATILSGGLLKGPTTAVVPAVTPAPVALASTAASPGPTPIAVGAGSVGWVGAGGDGALAYNVTRVDEVCPPERQPDCAPVADRSSKRVAISIRPRSISQSPVKNQAVVVGTDAAGGDAVLVIALPTPEPTPGVNPTPTARPTATPSVTPSPSGLLTSAPTASPTPTIRPTSTPTPTPTSTATATASVAASPSVQPSVSASPSASAEVTPAISPEPSGPATLAIIENVKIVGQSAAYSPDGAWFAFTARPSDDTAGPDIYVWRVGDALARPLTNDHTSVFASWAGSRLLGSRPAPAVASSVAGTASATGTPAATGPTAPQSFFLDPVNGLETPISRSAWRPTVDPTNHWAVTWDGTVTIGPDGLTPVPATGSLVLHGFTPDVGLNAGAASATLVAEGTFPEFDVRWDETGTWLAVWLADASDPSIGRLSLLQVDPTTGELTRPHGAPHDVTALPGFSIANGRLAWATPPGQGGEGSRVQIVAWTNETVGAVESGPVEDVVVVH